MSSTSKQTSGKPPMTDEVLEMLVIKAVILFFVAILVYIPAMNGGYIYDDDQLLYHNIAIRQGQGWNADAWNGLWSLWYPKDRAVSSDYAPLSSTTLWIEWRLWGNDRVENNDVEPDPKVRGLGAQGYHIDNIVLHAIAAVLLWYALAEVGVPGAWLAALVWAVHPVCVESVAWISERRNTLSMGFFMLTMICWFRFQRNRRWGLYALAVVLFVLTMLAKTSIVMLPFVLILSVWWLRKRVTEIDWLEAVPFFVISFIFGVITLYFQNARAIAKEQVYIGGFFERFTGACFALGFYLYKILLPVNLNLIYQQWHMSLPHAVSNMTTEQVLAKLNNHEYVPWSLLGVTKELIIGLNFLAFFYWAWCRRDTWGRHAIFGLGFFTLMIAPVLGFTRMAYMRLTLVSDHFDYAPMVGVIALCIAGLVEVYKRLQPSLKPLLIAVGAGFVAVFCCLTWQRAVAFSDAEKLWADNISKNPDSWQGHSHMGALMWGKAPRDISGAYNEWQQSAQLAPYLYETHNNYALVLNAMGRTEDALEQYKIAVDIEPEQPMVAMNYAQALAAAKRYEEAVQEYKAILNLATTKQYPNPVVYQNMGVAYFQLDQLDDAIDCFQKALAMAPNYEDAKHNLEATRARRQRELEGPAPASGTVTPTSAPQAPVLPAQSPVSSTPAPSVNKPAGDSKKK